MGLNAFFVVFLTTHCFFDVPYLPDSDRSRFTLSDAVRTEVLQRLLDLNKKRATIGVAEGNASATRGAAKRGRRKIAESHRPIRQPRFSTGKPQRSSLG